MNICIPCKIEMMCEKNGYAVRFSGDGTHVYNGDVFKCPSCGHTIAICNTLPLYDPKALALPDNKKFVDDDENLWMG